MASKLIAFNTKTRDKLRDKNVENMWAGHVSSAWCELVFALDLSLISLYSFDSVYRNLRESTLFILYVNEQDFEDFGFKMLTVGTARFW